MNERYSAKSNPIIVLSSTPGRLGDLMDIIRQQSEDQCFYRRMYLSYKAGLNKIYSPEEIEIQKMSLSFAREYDLSFESGIDALFSPADIAVVTSEPYDCSDNSINASGTFWLGCDPGFSTSSFGLVVITFVDGKIQLMYENEVKHADLDEMRGLIHSLIGKYSICRCFIDSSSISLIRQYCKISQFLMLRCTTIKRKTNCYLLQVVVQEVLFSVNFRTKHRLMLEQLHKVVSTHQIRIDPMKFPKVVTALRTATNKPNGNIWELDKTQSSSNDVLDALRLSLLFLRSNN